MEERITIYQTLDKLHLLLGSAKVIPMTGNKVLVSREEIGALLQQLEDAIAPEIKAAKKLLEKEEAILQESRNQAAHMVNSANADAAQIKQDADHYNHELRTAADQEIARAKKQAEDMVNKASQQAAQTENEAQAQRSAILADAQNRASAIVAEAQRNADVLVSDSEITRRAQYEAEKLYEQTQQDCQQYSAQVHMNVTRMLEEVDNAMENQVSQLRALRQQLSAQ